MDFYLRDVTVRYIHERRYPRIVKQWKKHLLGEPHVAPLKYAIIGVRVEDGLHCKDRLTFHIDDLHIQLYHFRAWAMMKAYYGFTIEFHYRKGNESYYSIGGHETEEIRASTIYYLLEQLSSWTTKGE